MKNTILKSIFALVMTFMALPMMAQDFMNIYFKDGTFRIFHFNTIVELSTSEFDNDGVRHMDNQYQHVKTEYGEFVYDINEIDSISFTKYKEDVVKEKISAVMDGALQLLSNCKSIKDAEEMMERFKNLDEVENVWSNGHSLNIKIKDWETISFLFNHGLKKRTESLAQSLDLVQPKVSLAMTQMMEKNKMPKIVIVNQTHNNMDDEYQIYKKYFDSLINDLKKFGYNSEDIYKSMPTLDFFYEDIYDYDIVLLDTHGDYDGKRHKILSGIELGKILIINDAAPNQEDKTSWINNYNKLFDNPKYKGAEDHITWDFVPEQRIINGVKKDYWVAYAVIYESFFQNVAKKEFSNKNSVLFNGCCLSLNNNNSFADILRTNCKLGTYLGYDEENTYGPISGTHFIRSVLNGLSVEKAYNDLKKISIYDENAESTLRVSGNCQQELIQILDGKGNLVNEFSSNLSLLPENQQSSLGRFVTSVQTNQVSQENVNYQFNTKQTVTVEGTTTNTCTDPNLLKCGFKLYINEPNYGKTPPWTIREIDDIEGSYVSSEINNFLGTLTGLERGKEYSYQAYTYDGEYYNYGNICSFTIEELQQDTRDLMFAETIGGVKYAIYKEILNENDYYENPDGWRFYHSELTLDITKNGNTDTYVLDNNIFLDKEVPEAGQTPCMMLDFNKDKMCVFINSKDELPYYSMNGNFYMSSISNVSFKKETVFENANWGWYPYFRNYNDDRIYLCNFSFAGYFTILAVRDTDGTWALYYDNKDISPSEAQAEWKRSGQILVIGNP